MKYYLHDTSAIDDEKVSELYINYGYEGVGLFYVILEKLGKQEKPIKTSVLKSQLKIGKRLEKCWSFMEQIGLISSNNGDTFNKQLLNFSEKYQIKKEKNAKRISEWRKNQDNTENVTHYEHVCNTPKVKESKVNRNKINRFIKPTLHEIKDYCIERNNNVNPDKFFNHYESNGWKVGKNAMKDWKAAIRIWEQSDYNRPVNGTDPKPDKILQAIKLQSDVEAMILEQKRQKELKNG